MNGLSYSDYTKNNFDCGIDLTTKDGDRKNDASDFNYGGKNCRDALSDFEIDSFCGATVITDR